MYQAVLFHSNLPFDFESKYRIKIPIKKSEILKFGRTFKIMMTAT